MRIGVLPGALPQLDGRVLVGGGIGRGPLSGRDALTAPSASARCGGCGGRPPRWSPGSIGWNSPKPAATRRCGEMPLLIRYCTTEMARAADRSQFEWKLPLAIGRTSVWPSTRSTQAMSCGICLLELEQRARELVELGAAFRLEHRPGRCRRTPPTGTRSGRRRCGCPGGCRGSRAAGRRSRSGSATVPARAAPARH